MYNKFLVTGGAGFIGSHLVDALIKDGKEVSVIDNLSTGSKDNLNPKATFYNLDINDDYVEQVFNDKKPEVVYHLASNTNLVKSMEDPRIDGRIITGSLNIFNNARKNEVKKIVMSSSAMVRSRPPSSYALSKISIEHYLKFFHRIYKIPIVILRYSNVFGPRQVGGALADYIRKIKVGEPAEIYGDGTIIRNFLYVDDVVRANIKSLEFEGMFELCSPTWITLNTLHEKVVNICGFYDLKPIYKPKRPGEVKVLTISPSRIKKVMGWESQVSLEEGLRKTINL